jgi:hypothetical protein
MGMSRLALSPLAQFMHYIGVPPGDEQAPIRWGIL